MKIIKRKLGAELPVVKSDEGTVSKRAGNIAESYIKCVQCNHKLNCGNCSCECPNNVNMIQTKGTERSLVTNDRVVKLVNEGIKSSMDQDSFDCIWLNGFIEKNNELESDGKAYKVMVVDGKLKIVESKTKEEDAAINEVKL